jgi:hypothetical protein
LLLGLTRGALAYEFEVRATTLGQGSGLRSFRLLGEDLHLARRRFTQSLSLSVWNIGRPDRGRAFQLYAPEPRGAQYYAALTLRIDHDFGDATSGTIDVGNQRFDAVDLIPELETSLLALDVLFAYVGGTDVGGFLDFELGRQLHVDALDWWSFDGLTLRAHTPWRLAVEGFAGMRVRDSAIFGSSALEPDGTGGGECAEYSEGEVPGSGSWRPIDRRAFMATDTFGNDYDLCPQRRVWMPAFGGAIATEGLPVVARLVYRRSVSPTPGLIGPVDRYDAPDVGFYPSERTPAPTWGVNEERVALSIRSVHHFLGARGRLTPFAAARYSLLHAVFDDVLAGFELRLGAHAVATEVYRSVPTFDGDSIFNVFSVAPYRDLRLTYELRPARSMLWGTLRAWLREFDSEDAAAVAGADTSALSAGGQIGVRVRPGSQTSARADLFFEDGYGGSRNGGYASLRWSANRDWDLLARLNVVDFAEDGRTRRGGIAAGAQVGGTVRLGEGIALSVAVEENTSRTVPSDFRLLGILDLAFFPEL